MTTLLRVDIFVMFCNSATSKFFFMMITLMNSFCGFLMFESFGIWSFF